MRIFYSTRSLISFNKRRIVMAELSPAAVSHSEKFTELSIQKESLRCKLSGCDKFKAIIYQRLIMKIERQMEMVQEKLSAY